MVHYSVLLPERDAAEEIGRFLPALRQVLDGLILPYEILCIDDGSQPRAVERLRVLLKHHTGLRVLRFDQPRGTAAALTAGIAAANGGLIIALGPLQYGLAPEIPQLVARLSRYDLVVAQSELSSSARPLGIVKTCHRLITRQRDLQADESMCWAAHRRSIAGITLSRGAFRVWEALLARRGRSISRLSFGNELPPHGDDYHSGPLQRLAARWYEGRFEPHLASELQIDEDDGRDSETFPPRIDVPLARPLPQPTNLPAQPKPRDFA